MGHRRVGRQALNDASQPAAVFEPTRTLEFVCPICQGPLQVQHAAYRCIACDRDYPVVCGIPDFRLFADPYLDLQRDRERSRLIADVVEHLALPELLEYYWRRSEVTPPHLQRKFIESALRAGDRARRFVRLLHPDPERARGGRLLEIGSGTGNLLCEATGIFDEMVGVDIAMRWLQLSRRRFIDRGIPTPALVCCNAEHLPFPPQRFDLAAMVSTLEFVRDPGRALRELARVLDDSGRALVNTVNRFSLATIPYADLWGVGYLPHSLQVRYVRWRRDSPFESVHMFSRSQIAAAVSEAFERFRIELADIDDAALANLPARVRAGVAVYRAAKSVPIVRDLLSRVTPEWDVELRGPKRTPKPGVGRP